MVDVSEHKRAMMETGFWGRAAAGAPILAKSTRRMLIAHRAEGTLQPHTWGTWGGAVDHGETAMQTVTREVREEAGYQGEFEATPLYVFEHASGFRYSNFLVVVGEEFEPVLNWETQGYGWFEFGFWPDPLHFGLVNLLEHAESRSVIARAVGAEA